MGDGEWHDECKGAWLSHAKLVLEFTLKLRQVSIAVCSVLVNITEQEEWKQGN